MDPTRLPVAIALFRQWARARGNRVEAATRGFSRAWDELLADAGLITAEEEREAMADARGLEAEGWVTLKSPQFRSSHVDRISIPPGTEVRWCDAFGFERTEKDASQAARLREHRWQPSLEFVREARLQIPISELMTIDSFLATRAGSCPVVPIKERSLELFGDEKRLDLLLSSALFRPDRLTLEHLRCELVGEPLGWERGPSEAAARPILVIENAATWSSYCRWNRDASGRGFSAVVYGCGNRFMESVRFLSAVFRELGGQRGVVYFGDLDPQGLLIPQEASRRATALGLPAVTPDFWSYRALLNLGPAKAQLHESGITADSVCGWLGPLAEDAASLFLAGRRLPQEHIGWEYLTHHGADRQAGAEQA